MPDTLVGTAVPVETDGHCPLFQEVGAIAAPTASGIPLPTIPVAPSIPVFYIGNMHRTALSMVVSFIFTEQLGHHFFYVPAFGNCVPVPPVSACYTVLGSQC